MSRPAARCAGAVSAGRCTYGSIAASPLGAEGVERRRRSPRAPPSSWTVVTSACTSSVRRCVSVRASAEPRKSTTPISSPRDEQVGAVELAVGDAPLAAADRRAPRCATRRSSASGSGSTSASRRPERLSTSRASSSAVEPAVTTRSVRTPASAANSVRNASCSTCWSRPKRQRRAGVAVPDGAPQRGQQRRRRGRRGRTP